ncbi:MAG: hypothetical protein FWD09_05385 [Lentimicrobiaceae bacterium]|nr:hypothetical protein [Lentimicrobiaceae bacterium]
MKRKLIKLTAFSLILLVALASSCQPEEPKEIEYTILPASLNFDAAGGEDKFTVTVTSPAIVESVESLSAWCQVSTNGVLKQLRRCISINYYFCKKFRSRN